jgi:HEPN domain-containing protein
MFNRTEWSRYLSQARHTLASARRDTDDGDFAWACFKSQQAAEMAAKGFIRAGGGLATGHSVVSLLQAAVEPIPDRLAHCARELDKVYIPTRYPDVYDSGSPHEYFDHRDAVAHVECAAAIVAHLESEVPDETAGS